MADQLKPIECLQLFRAQLEHEDNLINHRLSWLATSQALFATAYSIQVARISGGRGLLLRHGVPIVASLSCILFYLGIVAAVLALLKLRDDWPQLCRDEQMSLRVDLTPGSRTTWILGLIPPIAVPPLFIIAWVIVETLIEFSVPIWIVVVSLAHATAALTYFWTRRLDPPDATSRARVAPGRWRQA